MIEGKNLSEYTIEELEESIRIQKHDIKIEPESSKFIHNMWRILELLEIELKNRIEDIITTTPESIEDKTPDYYTNSKGSIYKFANDQNLNPWELDILKRVIRCRKKGQWKEDLEKTKHVIDLYLKEYDG